MWAEQIELEKIVFLEPSTFLMVQLVCESVEHMKKFVLIEFEKLSPSLQNVL
jgi:hypothetical protein